MQKRDQQKQQRSFQTGKTNSSRPSHSFVDVSGPKSTLKEKHGAIKGSIKLHIFDNSSKERQSDVETRQAKRSRNINVIKLNAEENIHSDSDSINDKTSLISDNLVPNSLVAAFSKPKSTHEQEGDIASETSVMHNESCLVNEAGKSTLAISDYTDHVTRFCKLSTVHHRRSAVDSNLCISNEEARSERNEQKQTNKMKMEETNKMTTQRQTPVKSVSAVQASLQTREANKKNVALKRGRRINTLNFPADNEMFRIQARTMPFRRPRRRRDSSSSLSSDSDDDLPPVREKKNSEHTMKLDPKNLTDKIIDNKVMHSASRVGARCRTRGSSNASDMSNSNDRQQQPDSTDETARKRTEMLRSDLGSTDEDPNDVKCYSVSRNVEIPKNQRLRNDCVGDKYATLPAKYQSTDTTFASTNKESKVNRASSQEADTLTKKGEQIRSLNDDRLIIKNEQTSHVKVDAGENIDVVKRNSGCHSSTASRLPSNQSFNPVSRSGRSGTTTSKIEENILHHEPRRRAVSELKSFYNTESANKAAFGDVDKRRQNFAQNNYENVNISDQVNQGQHLLKAKKVSVSYWPRDEDTKKLLNLDAVARNSTSGMNSIAKDGDLKENLENDYLQQLPKETDLSDPVNEAMPEMTAPVPPRRRNKSKRFQQHDTSLNNRQKVLSKNQAVDNHSDQVLSETDSATLEVETSVQHEVISNSTNSLHDSVDTRFLSKLNTTNTVNHNHFSSANDNLSPSYNESRVFTTSSISTRKSSLVSQSTALPRQRHVRSRDSEESEEMETAQNFHHDSVTFSSSKRRRASHRTEKSKPKSSEPSRSHSNPLANFSKMKIQSEQESFEDSNYGFPLKSVDRSDRESDNNLNSDSDLSGCSDSSSSQDDALRTITQTFGSDSSFKVLSKKNSIGELDSNLRRSNLEQDATTSYNSFRRSQIDQTASDTENTSNQMFITGSHSLPKSTKTFQAKERKFVDDENFKNSEESLFQPIKQERSFDSLSPTDNSEPSSMEDSLEQEEKEFDEMLETMSKVQESVDHQSKSVNRKPRERLQHSRLSRISERSRRPGVTRSYETNGDISSEKPYNGFNDFSQDKKKTDLRKCVVTNLLETEDSYVTSLRALVDSYLKPLKLPSHQNISELPIVDDVIFQVTQLHHHHQLFSVSVKERYDSWNTDTKIGELFVEVFNKDMLLKSYTNYINNFTITKEVISVAIDGNAAFKVSLEQSQRDSKQGLADLMIKPVQRVPRYELLIKDLLKHTPKGHPDYEDLLIAQADIHKLALQMNKGEKEAEAADKHSRLLQEIEQLIEGAVEAIGIPKRRFLQQEFCIEQKSASKKDRSLWLFNDMLMCTTVKKGRGASLRRSTLNLYSALPYDTVIDTANKYKYLWKYALNELEIVSGSNKQFQSIQEDLKLLSNIENVANKISYKHESLTSLLKEMRESLDQQLVEKQRTLPTSTLPSYQPTSFPSARLEIRAHTSFGMVKVHQFEFLNEESRLNFEQQLIKTKEKFLKDRSQWGPTLLKVIPISKTRNGMQFSCATSNLDTQPGTKEVWVCNTDGHIGQICFLTVESDPQQTQCLTVCNAKICCVTQVPSWNHKLVPTHSFINAIAKPSSDTLTRNRRPSSVNDPAKTIMAFDESDESDSNMSPYSTLGSASSASAFDLAGTGNDVQTNDHLSGNKYSQNSLVHQLLGSGAYKKDSNGSTLHGSLEDLLSDGSSSTTSVKKENSGSMWLGTEDGKISIFSTAEPIRTSRYSTQLTHNAAVLNILYHQGQVFVSLSNGDLIIYQRDNVSGQWDFSNENTIPGTSSSSPITKMIVVNEDELWCSSQNKVKILNIKTHDVKSFFSIGKDKSRQIYCMVASECGVWIAMDKNPHIKLFHSVTHDLICEVDVAPSVSSMLAASDSIIRQHKLACLRVTSLLVSKDLLWAGTSAGVVLTVALPKATDGKATLQIDGDPQCLDCGHTGHVRLLTEVEVVETTSLPEKASKKPVVKRRNAGVSNQKRTTTLVISGGDGFEEFCSYSSNNKAGKDDSTNHLLVWKV